MSNLPELHPIVAILVSLFLVIGSTLTLLGNLGLVRFRDFYDRLHAPTLGVSWGTAAIVLASVIFYSTTENQPVLRELVIALMIMTTSPIGFILLAQAARRRAPMPPDNEADIEAEETDEEATEG
ncbi:MAG: monovalent cation/H(+) antiporter subunit G [Paracoccus sp. (in: a-proteobacteria)]|nr:monovalent cation/H(+) antiporter subunit G [Paracoccus sp. (in: a-proteobacteria)]